LHAACPASSAAVSIWVADLVVRDVGHVAVLDLEGELLVCLQQAVGSHRPVNDVGAVRALGAHEDLAGREIREAAVVVDDAGVEQPLAVTDFDGDVGALR
jgi:hypothetical protein